MKYSIPEERYGVPGYLPMWVKDFEASPSVCEMSGEAKCVYFRLIGLAWLREATLPEDPSRIRKALGISIDFFESVWPEIEPMFPLVEGVRVNKRLSFELARARERGAKAKAAIEKRWKTDTNESSPNTGTTKPEEVPDASGNTKTIRPYLASNSIGEERRGEEKREKNEGGEQVGVPPPRAPRFVPPTVEEVREHVAANGYTFDPAAFVAHYKSNGWKVGGRAAMKSWEAACVTWQSRESKATTGARQPSRSSSDAAAAERGLIGSHPTPGTRSLADPGAPPEMRALRAKNLRGLGWTEAESAAVSRFLKGVA
ncbi:MAG: hypothetical protein ABIT01_08000 [Thermoanaerobaculia bacterium]